MEWNDGEVNRKSDEDPSSSDRLSAPLHRDKNDREWISGFLYFVLDVALNAVIIIGLVFVIRIYLIAPFRVFGPSMCDTLNYIDGRCVKDNGEYIIVNKILYHHFGDLSFGNPDRGDIIVFRPRLSSPEFYIKRIIGIGGDTVTLDGGYVYLENEEFPERIRLDESYLSASSFGSTYPYSGGESSFTVPEGQYFLLGDNRRFSSDSRHCFSSNGCGPSDNPFLSFENISGKAWVVLWPFDLIRHL